MKIRYYQCDHHLALAKFYNGDIIKVRKMDGKIIKVLLLVTVMVGLEKWDKRIWWDSKVVKWRNISMKNIRNILTEHGVL